MEEDVQVLLIAPLVLTVRDADIAVLEELAESAVEVQMEEVSILRQEKNTKHHITQILTTLPVFIHLQKR